MKQTAVQWFATKVLNLNISPKKLHEFIEWLEEAKKMEKEQMLEVSKEGIFSTYEFEQYYKETYESE